MFSDCRYSIIARQILQILIDFAARNDYDDPAECVIPYCDAYYDIPFAELEQISMPCINIGPWGKDFHKLTERVYAPDLYDRTPKILHYAISRLLK